MIYVTWFICDAEKESMKMESEVFGWLKKFHFCRWNTHSEFENKTRNEKWREKTNKNICQKEMCKNGQRQIHFHELNVVERKTI